MPLLAHPAGDDTVVTVRHLRVNPLEGSNLFSVTQYRPLPKNKSSAPVAVRVPQLSRSDFGLRHAVASLIEQGEYDSAIRKALVLLKTRTCRRLGVSRDIDGDRLVNHVFGAQSNYLPTLTSAQKQSFRDLFAGMYGLSRNHYAHNDEVADLLEVDFILANVNFFLRLIGDFHLRAYDVLLIESDKSICNDLADKLGKVGLSVQRVDNIGRAREVVISEGYPSILCTDRLLVGDRGKERGEPFTKEIRDASGLRIPVIYTSDYMPPLERDAEEHQLSKPFHPEALVEKVQEILNDYLSGAHDAWHYSHTHSSL